MVQGLGLGRATRRDCLWIEELEVSRSYYLHQNDVTSNLRRSREGVRGDMRKGTEEKGREDADVRVQSTEHHSTIVP